MPRRAYRATTAYVSGHVGRNMWLWIGIAAAATAVMGFLRWMTGVGVAGDLMAFCGCVLGILIMVQSQVGFVSSHFEPDEDEDELPAAQ